MSDLNHENAMELLAEKLAEELGRDATMAELQEWMWEMD